MKWWQNVSPVLRKLVALAVLTLVANATAVYAAVECEAVDQDGLPRECTLSEELGECGSNVLASFDQCLEVDDGWLWEQYCGFWAAVDLLACGLIVPWEEITGLG
ncbi:MAG TPA: hypothetical protein VE173_14760 [Longimicrobiales bacterium]|nr:hypothetical protein [Longimicrobiales bacterium]